MIINHSNIPERYVSMSRKLVMNAIKTKFIMKNQINCGILPWCIANLEEMSHLSDERYETQPIFISIWQRCSFGVY